MTDVAIPLRILSKKQVRHIVGLSFAHIARLELLGQFPRRFRLTNHPRGRCGWLEHEIQIWIRERAATRPTA